MSTKHQAEPHLLRSHDADADKWWATEDRRYYRNTKFLLDELIEIDRQINEDWPVPKNQTLYRESYPALWMQCQKRDLFFDSIFIFSAMAIEGFMNFYGVLRLGQETYNELFERFSPDKKIKALLLVCDSVAITKSHPLIGIVKRRAEKRNSLVHPKTKESDTLTPLREHLGVSLLDAKEAVKDMEEFFIEFVRIVPKAEHLVPNRK